MKQKKVRDFEVSSTPDHSKRSNNSSNTTGYNFMQRMCLPKGRFRKHV